MKIIKLLFIFLIFSKILSAQTIFNMQYGSYLQNFDSLANSGTTGNLLPNGWAIYETGSSANADYGVSTGSSTTGNTYSYGSASSTDRALGGLQTGGLVPSYGFGFQNNTGYVLNSIDILATMEQWRVSNTVGLDSCYFYYSVNADSLSDLTATWVRASALDIFSAVDPPSGGTLDGNLAINQLPVLGTINVNIPIGDTLFFKWVDINIAGSDDGLAVDDVSLTLKSSAGPIPSGPLTMVSMLPMDNDSTVSFTTTSLIFTFSDTVTQVGTGNFYIKDMNNSANDITVPANTLLQNGASFTYNSLVLLPNKSYAIQIDSNTFFNGNLSFTGINNNVTWNFKTLAVPTTITTLNENFGGCNAPSFGNFTAYSENGEQNWRCTNAGHIDTAAVLMNGLAPSPKANEDWLISPPIDVSGLNAPQLHFWSKSRFQAFTTKEILVSTNYIGIGAPSLATWTSLQVNNFAILNSFWTHYINTDLTPFQSSAFYVAFKYISDTSKADEWSLDDITITDGPLGVASFLKDDFSVKVVGETSATLNLLSFSAKNRLVHYKVIDLAGRAILAGQLKIITGQQQHQLVISALHSGIYLLQLKNEEAQTVTKFLVR